jgi:hypothetical protein
MLNLLETWTMAMEETNALRILGGKILSKLHGPVKEGERWGIRSNEEIKDMLQGEDIVKFTKSRAAVMKNMRKTAEYIGQIIK